MTFNTKNIKKIDIDGFSFKPCYKWMTFNTEKYMDMLGIVTKF